MRTEQKAALMLTERIKDFTRSLRLYRLLLCGIVLT
jgi:hypothetical protein